MQQDQTQLVNEALGPLQKSYVMCFDFHEVNRRSWQTWLVESLQIQVCRSMLTKRSPGQKPENFSSSATAPDPDFCPD